MKMLKAIYLTLILAAFIYSFPTKIVSAEKKSTPEICLATLAHWLNWRDQPNSGQSKFGIYQGQKNNGLHYFISYNGIYEFACDVDNYRVHVAQAPIQLGGNPKINYGRRDYIHNNNIESGKITITTSYQGGGSDSSTYLMKFLSEKIQRK